jgi:hypothetical protein
VSGQKIRADRDGKSAKAERATDFRVMCVAWFLLLIFLIVGAKYNRASDDIVDEGGRVARIQKAPADGQLVIAAP